MASRIKGITVEIGGAIILIFDEIENIAIV